MIINFAVALVVCKITTKVPDEIVEMIEGIRVPN